jgi:serine/threonine protein kinase
MSVNELLEDDDNFYIVSELLEGGQLFELLQNENFCEESITAYIIYQVL